MDARFNDCIKLWETQNARVATPEEKQLMWQDYLTLKNNAVNDGVPLDKIVETVDGVDVTYAQKNFLETSGKSKTQDVIRELSEQAMANEGIVGLIKRVENVEARLRVEEPNASAKEFANMKARAVISLIVDNNDTYGGIPMDKLFRGEITEYFTNFSRSAEKKFQELFKDTDFDKFIRNRENKQDILTELFEFEKTKGQHSSPATNRKAYVVAQEFYNNTTLRHKVKLTEIGGRFLNFNRMGLAVRWNKYKVQKVSRQEFVEDIAPKLDDIHGDITRKRNLAGQMYDDIAKFGSDDKMSWRNIGDSDPDVLDAVSTTFKTNAEDKGSKILFKNGESFSSVTARYSDDHTFQQLAISHSTELGRDITTTKMFGSRQMDGFNIFNKFVNRYVDRSKISSLKASQLDASLHYAKTLIKPEIIENSMLQPTFSIFRNIQAGAKLGSAVITALLDIPLFLVSGRRIFSLPFFDMLGKVFGQIPLVGRLARPADQKKFAEMFIEVTESWQDAAAARFMLNDGFTSDAVGFLGGAQKASAGFAHLIFKTSGLNWWTRTLQSSAAGLYAKSIGDLVKSGKTWAQITKENGNFARNWAKYGFTEADWTDTINRHKQFGVLDARGRLDPYKLGGKDEIFESAGGQTLRGKYVAIVGDAVDTMIMKPSQFDRMTAAWYHKDGKIMNQVMKTMTQFRSHPISFARKFWARTFKTEDALGRIHTGAELSVALMTMSLVTIQAKEFLAGRQTYDASKPDLYIQAFREAGVAGILGDIFMQGGVQKLIEEAFSEEKARTISPDDITKLFLGPLMGDLTKLTAGGFSTLQGGIRKAKGKDSGEMLSRETGDLIQLFAGSFGLERLWYTKMLYRAFVSDMLEQHFDPKGYERKKRRYMRDAKRSKVGRQKDNVLYKSLVNTRNDLFN